MLFDIQASPRGSHSQDNLTEFWGMPEPNAMFARSWQFSGSSAAVQRQCIVFLPAVMQSHQKRSTETKISF